WESGEGVTLRSDTVGGYPVAEIIKGGGIAAASRPMFPIVDYATFPNPDGSFDVGISVWVLGDQLNQGSLDHGILKMEARIISGDDLVKKDSIRAKLDAMRELLLITEDPRDLATMGYFNFSGILPGDYTVEFRVSGGPTNSGGFRLVLPVPSPRVTGSASDLMILSAAPSGDVLPGITRGERNLYANPLWALRRRHGGGIRFLPYIEFDPAGNSQYRVEVSLIPVPIRSGIGRGTASSGALRYLSNADGTVYPGWASPMNIQAEATEEPGGSNVVFAGDYTVTGQVGVFNEPVQVGDVRGGRYWLRFSISDPSGNPLGSALARVEIR
ncbi:MAG TPA: hypothetical protein VM118_09500, partial [Acidobacteriota bacterium]|nr:hypothetical protein [Acidobacteriota bacterium]